MNVLGVVMNEFLDSLFIRSSCQPGRRGIELLSQIGLRELTPQENTTSDGSFVRKG